MGEEFKSSNDLDINISNKVEHHDFDESEGIFMQKSYNNVWINEGLDVDLYVEYE